IVYSVEPFFTPSSLSCSVVAVVHAVDLLHLPCSSTPSTKNRATTNVSASSFFFFAANRRVCLGSPDHLPHLSLPMSSCSDSSLAIVFILAVSVSLQKISNNIGDFLCFATQALQPLDILKVAPIFSSVQIVSQIGSRLLDSTFQTL
ncbi:unnamed protein product, partial [Brassica rapa]